MKVTVTVEVMLHGRKLKRTATAEITDTIFLARDDGEDPQQKEIRETTETLLEALNGKK